MKFEIINQLIPLIAGIGLGTFFYLGLWWTVNKGMQSKFPAVWFFASLLVRTCITVIGFYYVAHGSWKQLLICFLGFFMTRLLVTKSIKNSELEVPHAHGA